MKNNSKIRVRFAPSPTGHLHIGGLRTALFNWLFARHNNGKYLLRIEDTDLERSKPEYTQSILDSLAWVGIESDESMVIQSERINDHKKVLQQLIATKKAYYCFCAVNRQEVGIIHDEEFFTKYDRHCRNRVVTSDDLKKPHVIRFALPDDREEVSFDDLIRGQVTIPKDQLDDFIIARSDGTPVYNFVVVVDDAYMKISHVIRGEDHILNTMKQLLLYEACEYVIPQFAHLPLILGPSGDRLSKRDAATSVLEYRKMGYLPDALLNYLVRLGWSHGDQEIFTKQELVEFFSLDAVGKKGSIFDMEKLNWVNSIYIKEMDSEKLLERIIVDVQPDIRFLLSPWNQPEIIHAINLYKERVKTVHELVQDLILLHNGPTSFDAEDIKKWIISDTRDHLEQLIKILEGIDQFSVDIIKDAIAALCKKISIKLVTLAQPIRIALIGKSSGPGVFDLIAVIGKQELLKRIQALLDILNTK